MTTRKYAFIITVTLLLTALVSILTVGVIDLRDQQLNAYARSTDAADRLGGNAKELARQHMTRCSRLHFYGGRHCEEIEVRAYDVADVQPYVSSMNDRLVRDGWKEDFAASAGQFFSDRKSSTSDVQSDAYANRYIVSNGEQMQTDLVKVVIIRHITPVTNGDFYGTMLRYEDEQLKQKLSGVIKEGRTIAVLVSASYYDYWL